MIKKLFKKNLGFTLVELLIVIAIIGVLSALLMANFIGVRQRARDAERKSTLRQIQSALELYRSDVGLYPTTDNYPSSCNDPLESGTNTYMTKVPCDPSSGSMYYYESGDGNSYGIIACLENASDSQGVGEDDANFPSGAPDSVTSACTSGKYYLLNNP